MRLPNHHLDPRDPPVVMILNFSSLLIVGVVSAVLCGLWYFMQLFNKRDTSQSTLNVSTSFRLSVRHAKCQTESENYNFVVASTSTENILSIDESTFYDPHDEKSWKRFAALDTIEPVKTFLQEKSRKISALMPSLPSQEGGHFLFQSERKAKKEKSYSVGSALHTMAFQNNLELMRMSESEFQSVIMPRRGSDGPDSRQLPSTSGVAICLQVPTPIRKAHSQLSVFDGVATDGSVLTVKDMKEGTDFLLGEIHFILTYHSIEKKLGLLLVEGVDLAAQDINGKSDPYVTGSILPQKIFPFKSKVIPLSLNPIWNEQFWFENITSEMISNSNIHMQVMDKDSFSKDDIIGNVTIPLSVFQLKEEPFREIVHDMWKYIQPCPTKKSYRGEILISLCYDTKERRILLKIHKARGLKCVQKAKPPSAFCKIAIQDVETKQKERRRTTVHEKTENPEWEYVVSYEVNESSHLSNIRMKISVKTKHFKGEYCLGRIVLGEARTHPQQTLMWGRMTTKPNEVISVWNNLYKK